MRAVCIELFSLVSSSVTGDAAEYVMLISFPLRIL